MEFIIIFKIIHESFKPVSFTTHLQVKKYTMVRFFTKFKSLNEWWLSLWITISAWYYNLTTNTQNSELIDSFWDEYNNNSFSITKCRTCIKLNLRFTNGNKNMVFWIWFIKLHYFYFSTKLNFRLMIISEKYKFHEN